MCMTMLWSITASCGDWQNYVIICHSKHTNWKVTMVPAYNIITNLMTAFLSWLELYAEELTCMVTMTWRFLEWSFSLIPENETAPCEVHIGSLWLWCKPSADIWAHYNWIYNIPPLDQNWDFLHVLFPNCDISWNFVHITSRGCMGQHFMQYERNVL